MRRALVTGSSKGIGRAIALRLAADGWGLALHCASDLAAADTVAAELGDAAMGIYRADLSQPGAARDLWTSAAADGRIDALVNNAGVYMQLDLLKSSDQQFEATLAKTMAVNFTSPLALCRLAAQHFEGSGGKIVNVASRVGFKGEAGAAIYAASKAALINLTRSLAIELAGRNIQTYGVAPGWVETAMAREGIETRLESILRDIPLGRMASPADCAAVCAFLLSEGAEYLSGVVIDVNGASYFH